MEKQKKEQVEELLKEITYKDVEEMFKTVNSFDNFIEGVLDVKQKTEKNIKIAQLIWNKCVELKEQHDANGQTV